jgi:acetyltransferase-like isoleucine patch superfamily enzyme
VNVKGHQLAVFDLLWCTLFCCVAGPPLVGCVWLFGKTLGVLPWWLAVGLVPVFGLVFLFGMTVMVWVIRLPMPRLVPGTYRLPQHRIAKSWLLHFALQRILYLPLWRPIYFSVAVLRTCALRALGARVPLAMSSGSDPQLLDPSLMSIGKHAVIGASVMTTCHFILADRLKLASITLGEGAQLHEAAKLAPGCEIGPGAIVGLESLLGPDCKVGRKARIGANCALLGDVVVGDGAKLEAFVVCDRGVRIGDKAVIATHTFVPAGTVIPAGARYPEGAVAAASDEAASDEAAVS